MHTDDTSVRATQSVALTLPSTLSGCSQLLAESDFHGSYSDWRDARGMITQYIAGGATVLDVACANGLLLASLLEWHSDVFMPFGFDISSRRIQAAKNLLPFFAAHLFVHNLYNMPWPTPKVDVVIAPWIAKNSFITQCLEQARRRVIFTLYSDRLCKGCDLLIESARFRLDPVSIETLPESTQVAVIDRSVYEGGESYTQR